MHLKIVSFKVRKKIKSSYQTWKAIADKVYFYFVISTLLNSYLYTANPGVRYAQDMSRSMLCSRNNLRGDVHV